MRIKVANYALNDLLYALECSGVTEVTCTKEDDDLIIIVNPKTYFYKKSKKQEPMCNCITTIREG